MSNNNHNHPNDIDPNTFIEPGIGYLDFFDGPSQTPMRLIHPEQKSRWSGWLFVNRSGQWVSLRMATDADLREIHRACKEIEVRRVLRGNGSGSVPGISAGISTTATPTATSACTNCRGSGSICRRCGVLPWEDMEDAEVNCNGRRAHEFVECPECGGGRRAC